MLINIVGAKQYSKLYLEMCLYEHGLLILVTNCTRLRHVMWIILYIKRQTQTKNKPPENLISNNITPHC